MSLIQKFFKKMTRKSSDSGIMTRRGFLLGGLLGLGSAYLANAQMKEEHHQLPTVTPIKNDRLEEVLQKKITTLQGFDPMHYLTHFDYGEVEKLPDGRIRRNYRFVAKDVNLEIAPGIFFPAWTYNGTVPGPTIRCNVGDIIRIDFLNRSLSEHTIHFHGIHSAKMDGVWEIIHPGESYTYEFVAEPAGVHLYHCHVVPVALHMQRGLYGAFIVDPETPRPKAKEMVMMAHGWDIDFDGQNELYALNGPVNFYRDNPIELKVGELARVYFINVLENDPINSLHIHANFFKWYRTGAKMEPDDYTDIVTLCQADRCMLEFEYSYPGLYMFHAHQNKFAELGYMGNFKVIDNA